MLKKAHKVAMNFFLCFVILLPAISGPILASDEISALDEQSIEVSNVEQSDENEFADESSEKTLESNSEIISEEATEEAIEEAPTQSSLETLVEKNDENIDACHALVLSHVEIVKKSEEHIMNLARKTPEKVTANDVLLFQKNLSNRYMHLDAVVEKYQSAELNCRPQIMPLALSVFDFQHLGETALSSAHLRRVVKSFSKAKMPYLKNLIRRYNKTISQKNIDAIKLAVNEDALSLNDGLQSLDLRSSKKTLFYLSDSLIGATSKGVSTLAAIWGFISDNLRWREGRIKDNKAFELMMRDHLKPLDIMFEKRKFVLSNFTIPGHWGHVALWLGSKEELQALGVWDQDYFKMFRQKIEEGFEIVEIRKKGMTFTTLKDFMNLDEVAIMRLNELSLPTEEIFSNLTDQSDKRYDFQFNAHTSDKITCTELITYSFGDIDWRQSKNLGLINMQPDDIAELSLRENKKADLILYLKGNRNKQIEVLTEEDWRSLFE